LPRWPTTCSRATGERERVIQHSAFDIQHSAFGIQHSALISVILHFPPLTVTVLEGDITSRPVDAIVNAANNVFWMGSGVAGAIKARGGQQIEREAVAQGPVKPGESIVTSAGALPARYVIHAAVMGQDLATDNDLIRSATGSALVRASERALESIAFPALGTGVGGFPLRECARIMVAAVREHAQTPTSIRLVEFVLFGERAFADFSSGLARYSDPIGTDL
jgi:O-acetyl-ADP-ribose deacetylase (regulator of RNase III)